MLHMKKYRLLPWLAALGLLLGSCGGSSGNSGDSAVTSSPGTGSFAETSETSSQEEREAPQAPAHEYDMTEIRDLIDSASGEKALTPFGE